MFPFQLEKNDLFILAVISGGVTAGLLSQKRWREAAGIIFSGITFSFFVTPALCVSLDALLPDSLVPGELFSSQVGLVALGYLVTLGGNALALKTMAWWQGMNLEQFLDFLLRRTKDKE